MCAATSTPPRLSSYDLLCACMTASHSRSTIYCQRKADPIQRGSNLECGGLPPPCRQNTGSVDLAPSGRDPSARGSVVIAPAYGRVVRVSKTPAPVHSPRLLGA